MLARHYQAQWGGRRVDFDSCKWVTAANGDAPGCVQTNEHELNLLLSSTLHPLAPCGRRDGDGFWVSHYAGPPGLGNPNLWGGASWRGSCICGQPRS